MSVKYYAENRERLKAKALLRYHRVKNDSPRTVYPKDILRRRKYSALREKRDPSFKILRRLRFRTWKAIKSQCSNTKLETTMQLLGCSLADLKGHIEVLFTDGMTWENYGVGGWHVDHIKPCACFDLSNLEQRMECFHFSNLQPLWCHDNCSKGARFHQFNKVISVLLLLL